MNNVYKNQRANDQSVFLGLKIMIKSIKELLLIFLFLDLYDSGLKLVSLSSCK